MAAAAVTVDGLVAVATEAMAAAAASVACSIVMAVAAAPTAAAAAAVRPAKRRRMKARRKRRRADARAAAITAAITAADITAVTADAVATPVAAAAAAARAKRRRTRALPLRHRRKRRKRKKAPSALARYAPCWCPTLAACTAKWASSRAQASRYRPGHSSEWPGLFLFFPLPSLRRFLLESAVGSASLKPDCKFRYSPDIPARCSLSFGDRFRRISATLAQSSTRRQSGSAGADDSMQFRVDLDIFRGPLDLLLYLVRKHELDVTDIRDLADHRAVSGIHRHLGTDRRRCGRRFSRGCQPAY